MKLLLVTPEYPPHGSGIANSVYQLRTEFLKKGAKVDVVSPHTHSWNEYMVFPSLDRLAGKIPFWQLHFWQQVSRLINRRSREYDVVWLHSPLMLSAKKLVTVSRLMVTLHSTYFGFFNAFRTHGISHLVPYYDLGSNIEKHFLTEISSFRNAILTTVSPSVAEETVHNGFLNIPNVVTNGITQENLGTVARDQARRLLKSEFSVQLPKNALVLIYSGRITEVKQPLLLVDLMVKIIAFRRDLHLLIVGSGNLLPKLKKKACNNPNLHFLSQLPHEKMPTVLSAADAFISLSCYEGLSLSVLESSCLGIPLILSDIPAHSWIIGKGIGNGILVDSHSPNPRKILQFLEKLGKKKAPPEAGSLRFFSWEEAAQNYLNLLM